MLILWLLQSLAALLLYPLLLLVIRLRKILHPVVAPVAQRLLPAVAALVERWLPVFLHQLSILSRVLVLLLCLLLACLLGLLLGLWVWQLPL